MARSDDRRGTGYLAFFIGISLPAYQFIYFQTSSTLIIIKTSKIFVDLCLLNQTHQNQVDKLIWKIKKPMKIESLLFSVLMLLGTIMIAQVKVETEREPQGSIVFYGISNQIGKQTVRISFSKLENLGVSTGGSEFVGTVGFGRTKLFSLKRVISSSPVDYRYTVSYNDGCHYVRPNERIIHLLPYSKGEKRVARENTNVGDWLKGKRTADDHYSLTFLLKEGDTIFASRKGLIIDLKTNVTAGQGNNLSYKSDENYMRILHDDCTSSEYRIFRKNSAFLKIGDHLDTGQPLAIADGSSYETGAKVQYSYFYLNYDNSANRVRRIYLKPRFMVNEKEEGYITNGKRYEAIHSEEVITQEMTKKQKKKRMKDKSPR